MTNPPNEFAQQLEVLFAELHNVLQHNLENKVSKNEIDKLDRHINAIEQRMNDIVNDLQKLNTKMQTIDENFRRMNQTINSIQQPSARVSPTPIPAVQTSQSQLPDSSDHSNTDQFNDKSDSIQYTKDMIVAGRKLTQDKKIIRPQSPLIQENEFTRQITNSKNYKESNQDASILVQNAINLLNDKEAEIVAIQTCILIDIRNMVFFENRDYRWYTKFINNPNKKTNGDLLNLFKGYGLTDNLLAFERVQQAIEELSSMQPDQLDPRINGISSKVFTNELKEFRNQMSRTINNRNSEQKTTDSVKEHTTPKQP